MAELSGEALDSPLLMRAHQQGLISGSLIVVTAARMKMPIVVRLNKKVLLHLGRPLIPGSSA